MSDWRPIATAPKDADILLFGTMRPMAELRRKGPEIFTGYWDECDEAWCTTGSTWSGPFYDPTHWMPLPEPPVPRQEVGRDSRREPRTTDK